MISAGIEAGGTKFVCGVGTGPHDLIREEFPTTSPAETTARAAAFLNRNKPQALASDASALSTFAMAASPPRLLDWQGFDIVAALREATAIDCIAFDTDVNAAALGEYTWGARRASTCFCISPWHGHRRRRRVGRPPDARPGSSGNGLTCAFRTICRRTCSRAHTRMEIVSKAWRRATP